MLAELLAHLGEVEARGIHRTRACSSLYTYCIYELRFSEDEAFRRVAAARLVRRFPALLDAIAAGELHLTGLLMLGPHLTDANFVEVLARAKHRTKRELARLVRILDPLPAVPARIEPLGPALARGVPGAASWETFVGSLCAVRELQASDRPRAWGLEANGMEDGAGTAPARVADDSQDAALARVADDSQDAALARVDGGSELHVPERCSVQFTATEECGRSRNEGRVRARRAATSRRPCAVPSSNATACAALTSTSEALVAERRTASSFIIVCRSR